MTQISFVLAAQATTTDIVDDATTSGPIKLPNWAPDIAWMSTTTVNAQQAIMLGTTGPLLVAISPNGGYNKRCFGFKTGREAEAGRVITLDYLAVGELVRT
jgi:hypothetical protein